MSATAAEPKKVKNYGDIEKIKSTLYGTRSTNKQASATKQYPSSALYSSENNRQSSSDSRRLLRVPHQEEATPCTDDFASKSRVLRTPSQHQQTTISDMYRNPSQESSKQLTFAPNKQFTFQSEQKPSGKKRGEDFRPAYETNIPQLTNKTSSSGFINDTLSKQFLNYDSLNRTFANLFPHTVPDNQPDGRVTSRERMMQSKRLSQEVCGLSTSVRQYRSFKQGKGREHSQDQSLTSRNVITGWNVIPEKKSGIMIVDKSKQSQQDPNSSRTQSLSKERTIGNFSSTPLAKKITKPMDVTNIFFREDIPRKFGGAADPVGSGSAAAGGRSAVKNRSVSNSNERAFQVTNQKLNSDSVKTCINPHFRPSKNSEDMFIKERSLSRNPINNNSQTMHALMIQPHILAKQPVQTQQRMNQILSTTDVNRGKMIAVDKNSSNHTKIAIKNETMGTPHRFQLLETSNKISSRHQNNGYSQMYSQTTKNDGKKNFFF